MKRAHVLGLVAIGAIALAYALPLQSGGCAQTSNYAAIRAFASGHPYIDRYANETCDLVRTHGHFYASKAPALAFFAVPWYLFLHSVGAVPQNRNHALPFPGAMAGVPLRALWQMGLWAVVLPSFGLLLLLRRTVERLEPGFGAGVAATLGLGTLVLPFSTLLFGVVPATALAFLAFAILFNRDAGLVPVVAAGAAAGLAVATDLPLVVPAFLLGLYAAARAPHIRRLIAFGAGGVVGLAPLLFFDWWAFRNPFHTAYSGVALNPGAGGVEQTPGSHGFFSIQLPSFRVAVELLLGSRGLFVLTPVVLVGIAGLVYLWRRGFRPETILIGALVVAEVMWDSGRSGGIFQALGGWSPGPRYLIPLLPFLCFALAPVLRRWPVTVGVLALSSVGAMVVATSAEPLLQNDDTRHWLSRIGHGNFTATVVSLGGAGHGWLAILPFYALVLGAMTAAIAATRRLAPSRRDLWTAAAAVLAWILVGHGAPELLRVDRLVHESWGLLAAIALLAGAVWAVVRLRPEGLLLLPFLTVRFDDHTKFALVLALLALAGLALHGRVRHLLGPA
jgi:hypothetical protein